ncbi:MAG: pilus assembly protein PilM [Gammaproteobacteria bacterium]|nr:pilus assembly protein PilM [Gammaproteobacteria bacterium]
MSALVERVTGALASGLTRRPGASRLGPVGLHFAGEQVHAVQLRQLASGGLRLRAWASASYPDTRDHLLANERSLRSLLSGLLGRGAFKGRTVVTALPPEMVRITSLNYQLGTAGSDPERIIKLMDERLEGPIGDYVVDYLPVRGASGDREKVALVATSSRAEVVQFLESLRRAGLDVAHLDITPAALNRVVGRLSPNADRRENILIINYGADQTYLTLISGQRLLMDKSIDFGANQLIRQLARALDITPELALELAIREGLADSKRRAAGGGQTAGPDETNPVVEIVRPIFTRLVEEIRRVSLYAASESQGAGLDQIYTFGTVARWPGSSPLLSEMARLPVADTLPLTAIFDSSDRQGLNQYAGIGPDLVIAAGLALRGLGA